MSSDELVIVTLREIADAAGISVDGARARAKRRARDGLWRILSSNHPQDPLRVEMPREDLNTPHLRRVTTPNTRSAHEDPAKKTNEEGEKSSHEGADIVIALQSRIEDLSEALSRACKEADKARHDADREREERREERIRSDKLIDELKDMASRMSDAALAKADAADQITRLEETLQEIHARPWWKRLAG